MPNRRTRINGRAWQRIRAYVLRRDHFRCQLTYPDLCTLTATQVDHIVAVIDRPDLQLDPLNLRAVCRPCHEERTKAQAKGEDRPAHVQPSRSW